MSPEKEQQLDELLAVFAKQKAYNEGAWSKVLEAARTYAVYKATGTYIERNSSGVEYVVHSDDRENMMRHFSSQVLFAAENALAHEIHGPV